LNEVESLLENCSSSISSNSATIEMLTAHSETLKSALLATETNLANVENESGLNKEAIKGLNQLARETQSKVEEVVAQDFAATISGLKNAVNSMQSGILERIENENSNEQEKFELYDERYLELLNHIQKLETDQTKSMAAMTEIVESKVGSDVMLQFNDGLQELVDNVVTEHDRAMAHLYTILEDEYVTIENFDTNISKISNLVADGASKLQQQKTVVEESLDNLKLWFEEIVDDIEAELSKGKRVDKKLYDITVGLDGVSKSLVKKIQQQQEKLENQSADNDSQTQNQQKILNDVQSIYSQMTAQQSENEKLTKYYENLSEELHLYVSRMDGDITNVQEYLHHLQTSYDEVDYSLRVVEDKNDGFDSDVSLLFSQLSDLQTKVDNDFTENMGAARWSNLENKVTQIYRAIYGQDE